MYHGNSRAALQDLRRDSAERPLRACTHIYRACKPVAGLRRRPGESDRPVRRARERINSSAGRCPIERNEVSHLSPSTQLHFAHPTAHERLNWPRNAIRGNQRQTGGRSGRKGRISGKGRTDGRRREKEKERNGRARGRGACISPGTGGPYARELVRPVRVATNHCVHPAACASGMVALNYFAVRLRRRCDASSGRKKRRHKRPAGLNNGGPGVCVAGPIIGNRRRSFREN